jgi:DNA-binding transcriptional LysR family regulator
MMLGIICSDGIRIARLVDFRQIQYFACLFEEGSVTRAARRLRIVQPALSMQIAKLEMAVGQKLFERSSRGMMPTSAARTMYRLYLPVLRDFAHAGEQMSRPEGTMSGRVRIGLIASVTNSVLSETLVAFSARYPDVEISVVDGYSTTFIDWVTAGQLDIALVNRPRRKLALDIQHVLNEEMVLVAGRKTKLPLRKPFRLKNLSELKLVLPSHRHGLRAVIEASAQAEDIDFAPRFEIDSLVSIAELVAATDFVTVLPSIAVHRHLVEGTLRAYPVVAPRIARQIVAISHPRRPPSPAAAELIAVMAVNLRRAAETFTRRLPGRRRSTR